MCLLAIAIDSHEDLPLVVIQNRDENPARPSQTLHAWSTHPKIYGGRDSEAGGTWLGMTDNGRFATILNHPFTNHEPVDKESRGNLVTDFLLGSDSAAHFIQKVREKRLNYDGFHLLVGDGKTYYLYSNVPDQVTLLEPGLHTVSNTFTDMSYHRMRKAELKVNKYLSQEDLTLETLADLFNDTEPAESLDSYPEELSEEMACDHAAMRIEGGDFRTVSTTGLMVQKNGQVHMLERTYSETQTSEKLSFQLNP